MKRFCLAATLIAGMAASLPAAAQFQKPEDAIDYRQSVMTVMGTHFGRINAMATGKVPFDAAQVQANADIVLMMSKLPFVAFMEGTNKGHDTKAKPEVWSQNDKFKTAAQKMQDEVVKLNAAAKTGNLEQIKTAFGDTGKACKACHDDFREK